MAKIKDIAAQIYEDLGEPSDMSVASISFWLQTSVGELNIKLNSDFVLNEDTLEISGLGVEEAAIFKKMYDCYFYKKRMRETIGAAGVDQVIEVQSDGAKVRKLDKNQLSKTYLSIHKDCQEELDKMVKGYKRFVFSPTQTVGDDSISEGTISSEVKNTLVDSSGQP